MEPEIGIAIYPLKLVQDMEEVVRYIAGMDPKESVNEYYLDIANDVVEFLDG